MNSYLFVDRGADYEFRVSAKNSVDYGESAVEIIRTPEGSEINFYIHIYY